MSETTETNERPTVCVDLDGVLSDADGARQPDGSRDYGKPVPGAASFLKELRKFARVVIHTTRVDFSTQESVEELVGWLKMHKLPFDDLWRGLGKPVAAAYVDDRAVSVDPLCLHRDSVSDAMLLGMNESFGIALRLCQRLCEN